MDKQYKNKDIIKEIMSEFNNTQNNELLEDPDFPYSPPSMMCNPIIDYSNIQFHMSKEVCPFELFEEKGWKFGILNLTIRSEIPISKKHIHIFFTIDASGSMSDTCVDGRTKMQHILYTLENMLHIFYEKPDCNISVHVQSFDTEIHKCIDGILNIKNENLEELLEKIKKIRPGDSTNIELALKSASEEISSYKTANPDHDIVHIFLTDGEITEGTSNYYELKKLVPNNCANVFIGYGREHDSHLLSMLGTGKSNEYRFVDALEKAGLVYGEIIHGLLYKAIEDVTITTCGCEIYDYLTNTWTKEISIGNLLSEQNKTYHLRSKTREGCCISVLGRTIVKTRQFQVLTGLIEEQIICCSMPSLIKPNLIKHMFRQRTQELLYESRKISEKFKTSEFICSQKFELEKEIKQNLETKEMKKRLKKFHKLMINYMKEHNLEEDMIMKMLCDDIYISNKTTGTSIGNMFTCARQASQGRQQTYTCSAIKETIDDLSSSKWTSTVKPILRYRHNTLSSIGLKNTNLIDDEDDDDDIYDYYIQPLNNLSPYISDTVITVMREVQGVDLTSETK